MCRELLYSIFIMAQMSKLLGKITNPMAIIIRVVILMAGYF